LGYDEKERESGAFFFSHWTWVCVSYLKGFRVICFEVSFMKDEMSILVEQVTIESVE